jgi:hypothetical protein
MTEEWRSIPDHEHYEVSSLGRVRSLDRTLPFMTRWGFETTRNHRGKILCPRKYNNGCGAIYQRISLDGGAEMGIHVAVCLAWHGYPPTHKHEVAHLDGKPSHNIPENVRWATHKENESDKIIHGTRKRGEENGAAKLPDKAIVEIFERFLSGETATSISESFSMTQSGICNILKRKVWRHIPIDDEMVKRAEQQSIYNIKIAREGAQERKKIIAAQKNRPVICQQCGIEFRVINTLQNKRKFCGNKCRGIAFGIKNKGNKFGLKKNRKEENNDNAL